MTVVKSKFAAVPNQLYETEAWATEALIRHVPVAGKTVWEPAAGNHKIADVLRSRGAAVFTSDIVTYQRQHDGIFNFFDPFHGSFNGNMIITNPPFGPSNRLAAQFARLALKRCSGLVALLLTAKFDFGKTRTDLFRDNPRFWMKIALLDRIQWFPGDTSGTEDHAWYVWGGLPLTRPQIRWEGKN